MSEEEHHFNTEKIDLIVPTTGKLFFEVKPELQLCKPHLMPLKSFTLEKLEKMQKVAQQQLHENRLKTAAPVATASINRN